MKNCPKLAELVNMVKVCDVGAIAADIETLAAFMVKALNNGEEESIMTLARLAKALKGDSK